MPIRTRTAAARLQVALALSALACGPGATAAPDGPAAFFARFRAAVAMDDAQDVAALTRLPFLLEGEPRDHAGFLAAYPRLFTPTVRSCLAGAQPYPEGLSYVVFCGPYGFYFGLDEGTWRLQEFSADGEDAP